MLTGEIPIKIGQMPAKTSPKPRKVKADDPGSLVDWLKAQDDDSLRDLLVHRPDLVHPVPADMAKLAARAATNSSITRVLDRLDAWVVGVAEVIACLDEPFNKKELSTFLKEDPELDRALEVLKARGVIWGSDKGMRAVPVLKEVVAPHPAGFGPCFIEERPDLEAVATKERIKQILDKAPKGVDEVISKVLWGPPVLIVEKLNREATTSSAKTPHEYLMAQGVLIATGRHELTLPREVAFVLRGENLLPEDLSKVPEISVKNQRDPQAVDKAAGGAGLHFVQMMEELLDIWGENPPAVLRNGGLAQRDLTLASRICDEDENIAALLAETALAAGLLAADEAADPLWLPTPAFDLWRTRTVQERWATLAEAWLTSTRVPSLVGKNEQVRINALSPEVDKPLAPEIKSLLLKALVSLPLGAEPNEDELVAHVKWQRPRREAELIDLLVRSFMHEANLIGARGLGALATTGRALGEMRYTMPSPEARTAAARAAVADPKGHVIKTDPLLVEAIAPLLPDAIDHFMLQADLTAVIPGPPESHVAAELRLLGYQESRGAAQVYRFSESSLKRALERGKDKDEIMEFFKKYSSTDIPQPLEYLLNDLVRQLGSVKITEDPIDDTEPAPGEKRSTVKLRPRPAPEGSPPDAPLLFSAIKALRLSENPKAKVPEVAKSPEPMSPEKLVPFLSEAIEQNQSTTISYAEGDGTIKARFVDPIRVQGGLLTSFDHLELRIRDFALSRINAASITKAKKNGK
ncbi:MAG: helicase-associated domain-containing protein [Candidatus Nanopelagicales bacterium]